MYNVVTCLMRCMRFLTILATAPLPVQTDIFVEYLFIYLLILLGGSRIIPLSLLCHSVQLCPIGRKLNFLHTRHCETGLAEEHFLPAFAASVLGLLSKHSFNRSSEETGFVLVLYC